MSQFLRPSSDVTTTAIASGGFADIDESSANDADYIQSNTIKTGNSSTYRCGLTNPALPPAYKTATTVRYRAAQESGISPDVQLTVKVYEGATLRATDTTRTLGASATSYTFSPDLSAVADFSNLELQFEFVSAGGGGAGGYARLYWAETEIPDPPSGMMMMF